MILKIEFFFIVSISKLTVFKFLTDFFEKLHPPPIISTTSSKHISKMSLKIYRQDLKVTGESLVMFKFEVA